MTEAQLQALVFFGVLALIFGGFAIKLIYDDRKRKQERIRRLDEFSKNLSTPLD